MKKLFPLVVLFLFLKIFILPGQQNGMITLGSERLDILLPLLEQKRVALIVNHTSVVGKEHVHLIDTLLGVGVNITKIMVPEHGFRGTGDAGQTIKDGKDIKTGIPIVSLYGSEKKPAPQHLKDVDAIVFDIQDVGARFYTYISTMHYAMEAAAENNLLFVVCDRPNPKDFVDGPVLEKDCRSFIGVHPIPVLHGLTVGELALMINGEGWLKNAVRCNLRVIPMRDWQHGMHYSLPVNPSPNLCSDQAIAWYPSLCLFEATIMSVGRGTDFPFETVGYPQRNFGMFSFIPRPKQGASNPLHKGKKCYGIDYRQKQASQGFSLAPIIHFNRIAAANGMRLINRKRTFELLIGNRRTAKQLARGLSEAEIRKTWEPSLRSYKELRKSYLLYPEY